MPESPVRKDAASKKNAEKKADISKERSDRQARRKAMADSRSWVAPTFVTVGLVGVLWLILYYIASPYIPFMAALGGWNMLIGMGLMAAAFAIATLWK